MIGKRFSVIEKRYWQIVSSFQMLLQFSGDIGHIFFLLKIKNKDRNNVI